jgi:hypothetical protein
MPAQERWSEKNAGNYGDLSCTTVAGGRKRSQIFLQYLLESHMAYLAGSHILRSWPGIRLMINGSNVESLNSYKLSGFMTFHF